MLQALLGGVACALCIVKSYDFFMKTLIGKDTEYADLARGYVSWTAPSLVALMSTLCAHSVCSLCVLTLRAMCCLVVSNVLRMGLLFGLT